LEFYPTPRALWKALNSSRYTIPQTLLVQFDRDDMDQSAKLATVLMASNSNSNNNNKTDLKFARLRGTHLTPLSLSAGNTEQEGFLQQWSLKSTRALWKAIQGKIVGGRPDGGNMSQEAALRDLRQSIVRYIADVVTK
jgi:hypothetical protein